jgi:hypothetical protein
MMINAHCLKEQVIKPTLKYLNDLNESTVDLLLGTAAVESNLSPLKEDNAETKGIGLFNISPQSHTDVWDKYLAFDPDLASKIRGLASQRSFLINPHTELSTNLAYATAIAWCIYRRSSVSLKAKESIQNLSHCWNTNYRQPDSAHSSTDFCRHFNELISGDSMAKFEEQTVSAA